MFQLRSSLSLCLRLCFFCLLQKIGKSRWSIFPLKSSTFWTHDKEERQNIEDGFRSMGERGLWENEDRMNRCCRLSQIHDRAAAMNRGLSCGSLTTSQYAAVLRASFPAEEWLLRPNLWQGVCTGWQDPPSQNRRR